MAMANIRIGITGGIGSGKTYVCQRLKERGISIYDCDSAAKKLIRTSPRIRQQLTALVGPHAYMCEQLNKEAIATFLLQSDANQKAINDIVHPAVADDFIASGMQWMECAILFESGFNRLVDIVIAVRAPEEVRIQRVCSRDSISPQKAKEWMQRQWNQDKVTAAAQYVIDNDGIANLDTQIDTILKAIAKQDT